MNEKVRKEHFSGKYLEEELKRIHNRTIVDIIKEKYQDWKKAKMYYDLVIPESEKYNLDYIIKELMKKHIEGRRCRYYYYGVILYSDKVSYDKVYKKIKGMKYTKYLEQEIRKNDGGTIRQIV